MSNNFDLIEKNALSKNARGGTELMLERVYDGWIPRDLLKEFQIIPSRPVKLNEDKIRILYLHDLPGDPAIDKILKNDGYNNFHLIVFVSNWQAQKFIDMYKIPWSKTTVLLNAIYPFDNTKLLNKYDDLKEIKLIYHTTPHRGLNVLLTAFSSLSEKHPEISLDVFSSFKVYGWDERDNEYEELFDESINYSHLSKD